MFCRINHWHAGAKKPECGHGYKKVSKAAEKGAMTVEAALILPLVLCVFFSVIFLIRLVYTYELIQHALDETASEIASAGYIYHISGFRDLHDAVRNNINSRSERFEEQIEGVFDAYNSLKYFADNVDSRSVSIMDNFDTLDDVKKKFNEVFGDSQAIVSDPLDELKTIACFIAGGMFDDAKTQLFMPIARLYMKKYLVTQSYPDVNKRIKALNVVDGFDGLDLSGSSFLSDAEENIDIVVRYKIKPPLPINLLGDIEIVQRVKVKAWMGGDEKGGVLDGSTSDSFDIWSLSNFQRGLKIRRFFGANLPNSFPVISKYKNGRAVVIKSMDLTASSYQKGNNTERTLRGYVNELAEYKGQDKPWGSDDIVIKNKDIVKRELVLVIPENKLSENNENVLEAMDEYAKSRGVVLTIQRYGTKKLEEEDEVGSKDSGEDNICSEYDSVQEDKQGIDRIVQ